jgi:gamma-glutamyl hercynylcysteine S-oxide synthase
MKKRFAGFVLVAAYLLLDCAPIVQSQDTVIRPTSEQIPGPSCGAVPEWNDSAPPATCTALQIEDWLRDITHWRNERRIRIGLDETAYRDPALTWTQSSFVQPQMMVHDRYFYDPATRRYTVDRYLNDVEQRYGGIDSVLIWHTYSNIGIDSRNQYDMFRDLPGGAEGVRQMVENFHRHHVRVLFPIMLWDQGTHEEGVPDAEAIARELVSVDADGINGDTLEGMPRIFSIEAAKLGHPLALEPEVGLASDEMLAYNTMTWGYWDYKFIPSVSRFKWLETRHMVNICNRWAHDHTDDLQGAFFNGVGFESWENIWGIWNQMTPRDAEALRRTATIERAFADLLISPAWMPHYPMQRFGVFASEWPGATETLWTIVNRSDYPVSGREMRVPFHAQARYFDLWRGVEIQPQREGDMSVLSFDIESKGFGAVLEMTASDPRLESLLARMHELSLRPLSDFSHAWQALPQQMPPTAAANPPAAAPVGMIRIPAADYVFRVNGIEIEGGNDEGVDFQYPWESSARRYHEHKMHLGSFWIDKYPVTNAEYKRFLDVTHYRPADDHNFLKDWVHGMYPQGWGAKPVTWVSLEDARSYAQWAGKRLPHEWEWQYAAQGGDGRMYPWGNASPFPPPSCGASCNPAAGAYMPVPDTGRDEAPPSNVDAHPAGASPFGVMDLVGNVWQWTDEYVDDHTRAAVLRGGSHYRPQGSRWYFPQAYQLSQHGKYLLMAPGLDRSASIGFRCVVDAQ